MYFLNMMKKIFFQDDVRIGGVPLIGRKGSCLYLVSFNHQAAPSKQLPKPINKRLLDDLLDHPLKSVRSRRLYERWH